ncbi:hypothetical protein JOY44_28625 (plasmid) [Phormidium sp. CLA17]|uniref:hypothetical protein n=1 Tax=Leptolyngbya sp. Cla-17 TaxID=2803751 RepID=UPI0014918831|nr:hypothetical protein [Leptolyngbya sp. Cla-17]MBM0745392.1 hypothetical protein [Leptolyngbya sp. Cla-17]
MSLEHPSMAAGYLHQILVNGATPFRYRSNVRSLLGMPDIDATPPAAANLPPIEFLYAIPRSISANLPDSIQQSSWESDSTNANELVREVLPHTPLTKPPITTTIPGITNYRSPSLESRLTIPGSLQPAETNIGMPEAIDSIDSPQRLISAFPSRKIVPKISASSIETPQHLVEDSSIKDVASESATLSFRKQASTDTNTTSINTTPTKGLASQTAPLPIATTPIPMASAIHMPPSAVAVQPAAKVTEELTRLRHIVADLTAQVTAQKEFQRPAPPIVLPPSVQIVERSVSPQKTPQAFWERSYVSRLYRWSRR